MLTVTNLSIRTKQTKETLVRSVSFSVKNGEALGLIGESGSGKPSGFLEHPAAERA